MKRFSRVLALLLALALTPLGALNFSVRAAEETTVYVNGASGSDAASGLDAGHPVQTFRKAYEIVYTKMEESGKTSDTEASARIVLTGDTDFALYGGTTNGRFVPVSANHVFRVVISGQTGAEKISFRTFSTAEGAASPKETTGQAYFTAVGPTTFENLLFVNGRQYATIHAAAEGALVIGENVDAAENSKYYYSLVASPKVPTAAAPSGLIVHSGTWMNLYAASYANAPTSGRGYLYMDGGTSKNSLGCTYNSDLNIPCEIHLKNVTINNLYAAHIKNEKHSFKKDLTLDLENVTVNGAFALDCHAANTIDGDLYLSLVGVSALNELDTSACKGTVHQPENLNVPAGESVSLTASGSSAYYRLNGGGTIVFGQNSALKITGEVVGTTSFSVSGGALNRVYIEAPSSTPDSAFVYTGEGQVLIETEGAVKRWRFFNEEAFQGLVLKAPVGVTVTLSSGFAASTTYITPDRIRTENGFQYQYFASLSVGNYRAVAKGTGYYTLARAIWFSQAKKEARTEVELDPGLRSGRHYEPSTGTSVLMYTDEMYEKVVKTDDETWAAYSHLFTTPSFGEGKAKNEFTSQEEMTAFLKALDDPSKNAYQFTLTTSETYGFELPIVVFTQTDLSACATWQEAASLVKANDKITVHYQAQIHGNEPAGGEAALIFIDQLYKNDAWREGLLDQINLYIIPRVNPDGSYAFTRNTVKDNDNMNRDLLTLYHREMQAITAAAREFDAYVKIDGHEYTANNSNASGIYSDVFLRTSGTLNNGDEVRDAGVEFILQAFSTLGEAGIRASAYPDVNGKGGGHVLNACNPSTGTATNGFDGALSFLVETRGIGDGKYSWKRRLVSQFITMKSLIEQTAEKTEYVKKVVEAEREFLVNRGKTFDPSRLFVLEVTQSKTQTPYIWANPRFNYATGEVIDAGTNAANTLFDTPVRTRALPTAYVLAKGEDWEAEALRRLTDQGVLYSELPAGAEMSLRQYLGSETSASLAAETSVCFEKGAILIPMNQIRANFAAYLLEPDTTEGSEDGSLRNSFAQTGVAEAKNGVFPIYRYEHDLQIDHIEIQSAPEKTKYLPGETLDSAGLCVTVKYQYGCDEAITEGFTLSGFDSAETGEKTVTVTYEGKTAEFTVRVAESADKAGDVNGDEVVSDADAIYLLMHTFFPEMYPIADESACDYNHDGVVTDADAIYLLMYTFFPEMYPIDLQAG